MKKSVIAVAVGVLLVSHGALASPCGKVPCYIENGLNVNIDLTQPVDKSDTVNIAIPNDEAISQGRGNLGVINITVTGSPSTFYQVNGLNFEKLSLNNQNKEFYIDSFSYNSTLSPRDTPATADGDFNPNALLIKSGKLTIGDVYIHSVVTVDEQYENNIKIIPHNGLYSHGDNINGAVVTINGSVYINNEIPSGYQENYEHSYTDHSSKSDAVSGKKGGTVIINPLGGKDVQLFGNLDVTTNGTIELTMDTPASRWEGHLVAAKYKDGSFQSYGKKFNLTLSNGAIWIPDAQEEYIGKYKDLDSTDFKSVVNLKHGGIIDLYGDNRHTGNKGYTNKLTIDNLQADKGRFIIFSSLDNGKNDMLFIKSGKGTALVEPVDPKELKDVSTEKPILFADVSKNISFEGYDNIETLDDGFLYSYVPVVEKNVLDASSTSSKYGDLWYIVGVTKNETPAIEVPVSDANLHFASATSFMALDTLNKRMGEVRDSGIETSGLWARVKAGRISSDQSGYFKDNFQFYQIGYDHFITGENGNWILGGALHHTESNSTFHYGSGDLDNTGLSGYASWFNEAGCYADVVAKYSWISDNYQVQVGNQSASADYDSHALTLSAEVGKQFILQKSFFVEPQMQLAYTRVGKFSYALTNGVGVHQAGVDSLIGRMGVRLGTTFAMPKSEKTGSAYLRLDGYHEFDGDRTIALQGKDSSYAKSINGSDSWMSYGLGVTLPFARNTSFYAEVERSAGGDIQTDWQVNGGLRIQF